MSSSATKKAASKADMSARILELQKKIYDPSYLEGAIQRIAQVMSNRLVEQHIPYKEQLYVR